ncbi:hypothetical protein GIB67_018958 [Kingdonia uniflora]|uniref:Protein kinase domain-containing protein n=1 Tax=Kingdonia uniflora TaxID=39325 RepID=A0A7J7N5X3_9MAGN|nr:hypothetical protein GIB67_018958 [Kingdonia uniflora]
MAPEWNSGHGKTEQTDIFSFGKVLLDLFLGQRSVCFDRKGKDIYIRGGNSQLEQRRSIRYIKKKLKDGKVLDLIDKRLMVDGSVEESVAANFVCVAIQCLKEDPQKRQCNMWKVFSMIEPVLAINGKSSGKRQRLKKKGLWCYEIANTSLQLSNFPNCSPFDILEVGVALPSCSDEATLMKV